MRIGWLFLAGLAGAACGGGDDDSGDGDADADADADADGDVDGDADGDACGSGDGGAPRVAWAVSGGSSEDDGLADLALAPDCTSVLAAINHRSPFVLGSLEAEAEGELWRGLVVRVEDGGEPAWSASFTGTGHVLVNAIATTREGRVWVGGAFEGTADLAGETATSVGDDDGFAVLLDADGAPEAIAIFSSEGSDVVFTLIAPPDGTAIVAGTLGGPMNFFGYEATVDTPAQDVFATWLSTDCEPNWFTTWGGNGNHNPGYEYPRAAAIGHDADLLVVGRLANASTPGDWTDDNVAFVRSLRLGSGEIDWGQDVPWGYGNWGEVSVASLVEEGFALGGGFNHELELGDVSLADSTGAGLVARMAADGTIEWVTLIDGPQEENVRDVAPGVPGEIVAIGDLSSGVDLPEGAVEAAGTDTFLAGLSTASGDIEWSLTWSGGGDDRGGGVAASSQGALAIGGEHAGTLSIGDGSHSSLGGRDVWIAMLRR